MVKRSKLITYGVIAIAVVWVGGCIVRREQPVYAKWNLKRQLRSIEPWGASTNYTPEGWKKLVQVAGAFQRAEAQLATDALTEDLQQMAGSQDQSTLEQGKVFLLLRMIFNLPERAPVSQRPSDGWTRGESDSNGDGTVNLAWPLVLDEGRPRLEAGREGTPGNRYVVGDDYTFLRYKFGYRDLSTVRAGS